MPSDGLISGHGTVVCYFARTSEMVQSQERQKQGGHYSVLHFITITSTEPWRTIPTFLGCSRLASASKSHSGSPSVRHRTCTTRFGGYCRGSCPSGCMSLPRFLLCLDKEPLCHSCTAGVLLSTSSMWKGSPTLIRRVSQHPLA